MKILHVIPNYVPAYIYGGPVKSTHDLCRALCARGIDNLVLTTNANGKSNLDVALNTVVDVDGVKVIYCRRNFPGWYFYSAGLGKALAANIRDYDLVHIHSVYLYPAFIAALLARKFKKPYIINPLGAFDPHLIGFRSSFKKNVYIRLIEMHNISGASMIHASSILEKEAIVSMGVKTPVAVVPRGLNMEEYREPPGRAHDFKAKYPQLNGKKIILFLGRIDPQKGVNLLLEAFKLISAAAKDAYLVIAGPAENGYLRSLKRYCAENNLSGRVLFPGPLFKTDKLSAFYGADLFVLPSFKESFGISVLEAMAVGLPVIVTKRVGLAGDIKECGAGIITDYVSQEICDAVLGLLGNEEKRRAMGQKGGQLVGQRFLWGNMSEKMIFVYNQVLGQVKAA